MIENLQDGVPMGGIDQIVGVVLKKRFTTLNR